MKSTALRLLLVAVAMVVAACTSPDSPDVTNEPADQPAAEQADEQRFPDVVEVSVERTGDTYSFSVTISSPYDSPQRYADGWRVMGPDGTVYGEHTLAHDHANEQPFTRTQTGVEIPDDITEVIVEGRDLEHGYGGDTKTVQLPGPGGLAVVTNPSPRRVAQRASQVSMLVAKIAMRPGRRSAGGCSTPFHIVRSDCMSAGTATSDRAGRRRPRAEFRDCRIWPIGQ